MENVAGEQRLANNFTKSRSHNGLAVRGLFLCPLFLNFLDLPLETLTP